MNKYEENQEKYAMGEDLQTTKHHPGYSIRLDAEENYCRGLRYARSHKLKNPHLHVARELMQLANTTHKEVFKEAAEKAYKEHRKLVKV